MHDANESTYAVTSRGSLLELQTSKGSTGLEKARKPSHFAAPDAVYSPCSPSVTEEVEDFSEEDSDVVEASDHGHCGPRIGANYQANLEGLYGSEIAEDNAELLWDPNSVEDDILEVLLAQTHVNDSTFKQISASRPSTPAPASPCPSGTTPPTNTHSAAAPALDADSGSKFLDLESMLQLVRTCSYRPEVALEQLKSRGLFGWSGMKSSFTPWSEEEKAGFEIAFGSLTPAKQFELISAHIKTRNVGDCIEYYYGWKHSERCKTWKCETIGDAPIAPTADDPVPMSRMLPSSVTRKRKREVTEPSVALDSSERMYLEALDHFHTQSASPELLLNIILDAPDFLAQDSSLTSNNHPTHGATHDHHHHHLHHEVPIIISAIAPNAADAPTNPTFDEHHAIAGADDIASAIPPVCRLSNAAASPKRAKLSELPEHHSHSMSPPNADTPLSGSTSTIAGPSYELSASATIDPHDIFSSIFSPPEPTMDLFMHF